METSRTRIAGSNSHQNGGLRSGSDSRTNASRDVRPSKVSRGHIVAIDGLRALAILGVVAYHTRPSLLRGGFLGVTIFFVISGFLITRSVMTQLDRERSFTYGTYLVKRLKRLVPPALVTIAIVAVAAYCVAPSLLPKAQADALPSALFVSNWVYIFRHVSYFAAAGLPSPLTHLWFLGVLMQFYLLWPLVLIGLYRVLPKPSMRIAAVAVLMLASCVLMGVLYDPTAAGSRVYYGLDTRASELLAGALLAMLLHGHQPHPSRQSDAHSSDGRMNPVSRLGIAIMVLMVIAFVAVRADFALLYRGGYLVVALLTALLLAVIMVPGDMAGRILSVAPLRYIGSRSFSLYLVHYPMLEMMNPATRTTALAWWEPLAQVAAMWAATELFYQVVERTFAKDNAASPRSSSLWAQLWGGARAISVKAILVFRRALTIVCAVCVVAFALPLDWNRIAQDRSVQLRPVTAAVESEKTRSKNQSKQKKAPEQGGAQQKESSAASKLVPVAEKVPKNLDTSGWTYDAATGVCSADPLIIGDSVELGAQRVLVNTLPNAVEDSQVGRRLFAFGDVYQQYASQGKRVTIAALGSNEIISGAAAQQGYEAIAEAVKGKPLYFITIRDPAADQDAINAAIRAVAAQHDNIGVMDWYGLSEGHSEYFYDDGVHLTIGDGLGRDAYAHMITSAMCGQ